MRNLKDVPGRINLRKDPGVALYLRSINQINLLIFIEKFKKYME